MPKIYDLGEFWIESFVIARAAIAQGLVDSDQTLSRAGFFVGASMVLDGDLSEAERLDVGLQISDTADTELTYGEEITQVRIKLSNNNAGARTFGAKVIIFLRA